MSGAGRWNNTGKGPPARRDALGRRGGGGSRGSDAPAPPSPNSLLADAETLQQRAERRKGAEALSAFEAAAAKFQAALETGGLPPEKQPDAWFGMAECLQLQAEATAEALKDLSDSQLTVAAEQQAAAAAAVLFERAVAAYRRVPCEGTAAGPTGVGAVGAMRADAAVNAGNALCAWAGLLPMASRAQAIQLLEEAVSLYRVALEQEEDAATWSNLADALTQLGDALLAAGSTERGSGVLAEALATYEHSCSLVDSGAGDDLPGLLHNWGVGLFTASQHAQDPGSRTSLLEQAARRLRDSITFGHCDPAPHNALGDVLMAHAELASSAGDSTAAVTLVRAAAQEGYLRALTIHRRNADALVGLAEAAVALGRAAAAAGDATAAAQAFNEACQHYGAALTLPSGLPASRAERLDVRYNAACALARAGREAEARAALEAVAAAGALQPTDAARDEDLAPLHGTPWFRELLAGAAQQDGLAADPQLSR